MKSLENRQALAALEKRRSEGLHVDSRLLAAVATGNLYLLQVADAAAFFSLIWHARNDSRLLTPNNESRTIYAVAIRMIESGWSFADLASSLDKAPSEHSPKWFKPCVAIDKEFSYQKLHWIAVTPANDDERKESPDGTFYIFDGAHKSLVLAKKLLTKEIDFEPFELLLLTPRR